VNQREREALLEAAATAYRESDREGRLVSPPAWWDLPPDAREELFELQVVQRRMESAASPDSATATARAVLARILGL
jgi:hypothetical protein